MFCVRGPLAHVVTCCTSDTCDIGDAADVDQVQLVPYLIGSGLWVIDKGANEATNMLHVKGIDTIQTPENPL